MPNYKIFETNEFIEQLETVPKKFKDQFKTKLINYIYPQLIKEPHYGQNIKKLFGYNPDAWRYRLGKYRLIYIIQDNVVSMLTLDLRKDIFKKK